MMYACEIMATVMENNRRKEEERKQKELEKITEAMEEFYKNLKSLDEYVEKQLIKGNGKASLLIDTGWFSCEGFWFFAEKDYRYSKIKPFWYNTAVSKEFPLEIYVEYLRNHCFNVEIVNKPFKGYSSTGKTDKMMKGITLEISI